jgi:hypothetical protein
MTAGTMSPGQLTALDQAITAYRQAAAAFADMTGSGQQLRAAEAELRRAGLDEVTGLITLPIAAVHFADVRADGARMAAVCGSIIGGRTWVAWSGRCVRFGVECQEYDAYDLIQLKA